MNIFKFLWPYKEDPTEIRHIKYDGRPIGHVIDVEETEEGLIVTGQFTPEFTEGPDYKKLFIEPDRGFYSLGPIPAKPDNYVDYCKGDAEMTMALYGVHPEYTDGSWIKPGTKWGCLTIVLASLGFWFLVYLILHWIITGNGALFDWS